MKIMYMIFIVIIIIISYLSVLQDQSLTEEQKRRIFKYQRGVWIEHPDAMAILEILQGLYEQPKKPRMKGMTLVGPTNNGKTSIILEFIDMHRKMAGIRKNQPFYEILYVEAPEKASIKSLYFEILSVCSMPKMAKSGTAMQLKSNMIDVLKRLKVKMLFIDEIHNLLTSQTPRILDECLNALKGLSNRLRIPIVLVGTKEAEEVIKSQDQVENRYRMLHLPKWRNNKRFQLLLATFEKELDLKYESKIYQKEIRDEIFDLSGGILGEVAYIIQECAIEAVKSGKEKITRALIDVLHRARFPKF